MLFFVRVLGEFYLSSYVLGLFFFEQKTAYDMRISAWSSDVCSSDLKRLSYAALHDRAGRCAGLFRSLGVGEEDRVCILALNSHRNLEALFGAIWAGGIAAPLNYRLSPAELVGIVRMVEARVLVVDDEFLPLAETLRAEAGCIEHVVLMSDHAAPAGLIDYEAAIARADAAPDARRGGNAIATV